MKILSQVISLLFHPVLMPTLGLLIIFMAGTHLTYMPVDARRIIILVVFVSTCIFPLSLFPLLYHLGFIKTLQMETARERLVPLIFTGFFFYLGYMALKKMGISGIIENFILGSLVVVVSSVIFSAFWKISIHMIGIGGITGAIMAIGLRYTADVAPWILALFLAAGIIASARLHLGSHNPAQVYAGYLFGFFVVAGSMFL